MQVQGEDKPYDDINITPMLDLAYVLLVIFILMCTASVQGVKVNLPRASAAPSLAKPKTRAISVNSEGNIFLDTIPVTLVELERHTGGSGAVAMGSARPAKRRTTARRSLTSCRGSKVALRRRTRPTSRTYVPVRCRSDHRATATTAATGAAASMHRGLRSQRYRRCDADGAAPCSSPLHRSSLLGVGRHL